MLHLPNLTKKKLHENELKGDMDILCNADNVYTLRQDISLIDVRADCKAKDEVVCKCCNAATIRNAVPRRVRMDSRVAAT